MYQSNLIIVGNLGRDPEMRYTPSGVAVTNFSVAVNETWTGQDGEQQERTTWFRVAAWRKLAEVCNQYLSKGRLVLVEGRVSASAWMPQDGGDPRATLELTARTVKFLGRREAEAYDEGQGPPAEEIAEDAIPF
jgi:single-strand DNA-binding protein